MPSGGTVAYLRRLLMAVFAKQQKNRHSASTLLWKVAKRSLASVPLSRASSGSWKSLKCFCNDGFHASHLIISEFGKFAFPPFLPESPIVFLNKHQ